MIPQDIATGNTERTEMDVAVLHISYLTFHVSPFGLVPCSMFNLFMR